MKLLIVICTVSACLTGIAAAWYWWAASTLTVDPTWKIEPGEQDAAQAAWIAGMLRNLTESSRANSFAAKWTAVSVLLSCVGGLLNLF